MIVQNGKVKKSAGIQLPADLSIAFDYILLIRYLSVLLYQFFYFRNQIFFIASAACIIIARKRFK